MKRFYTVACDSYAGHYADMAESADGSYVLYDDVQALIKAARVVADFDYAEHSAACIPTPLYKAITKLREALK